MIKIVLLCYYAINLGGDCWNLRFMHSGLLIMGLVYGFWADLVGFRVVSSGLMFMY